MPWFMLPFIPVLRVDPNRLFTVTVNLMWQLYYEADDQGVPWAREDGVALVATLVGLIITASVSDGLEISGALTWGEATAIVWVVSLIGVLAIPALLVEINCSGFIGASGNK